MTGEEALRKIHDFIGKTLEEIQRESGTVIYVSNIDRANKGFLGNLLELTIGKIPDNQQQPDLDDGTEIKKVSIAKGAKGYRVKETLQITMIHPNKPLNANFEESHLFEKTRKILLIPTLYSGKGNQIREKILPPVLWTPSLEFDELLRTDYEEVARAIADKNLGFNSLSGKMGKIVQPRTKGAKNSNTRAFYFRTQSVNQMLGNDYLSKL